MPDLTETDPVFSPPLAAQAVLRQMEADNKRAVQELQLLSSVYEVPKTFLSNFLIPITLVPWDCWLVVVG